MIDVQIMYVIVDHSSSSDEYFSAEEPPSSDEHHSAEEPPPVQLCEFIMRIVIICDVYYRTLSEITLTPTFERKFLHWLTCLENIPTKK